MKNRLLLVLVLPAILLACQKEEAKFNDDILIDGLELKSNDDHRGGEACFEIQFPLTVIMPDGTEIERNSRTDLANAIKRWYHSHDKVDKARIKIKYPISVLFKGKLITLENERQFERVKMACKGDKGDGKDKKPCFELVFPINYTMPDHSVLKIKSKEHQGAAFKRWYNAHPRMKDTKPKMIFPIEIKYVTDRGDRVVDVQDVEALKKAYAACKD